MPLPLAHSSQKLNKEKNLEDLGLHSCTNHKCYVNDQEKSSKSMI